MNYGSAIAAAMLQCRRAKAKQEKEELESKLSAFVNKWLTDAENGAQEFTRVFEYHGVDILTVKDWCREHGLEVKNVNAGKYEICIPSGIV